MPKGRVRKMPGAFWPAYLANLTGFVFRERPYLKNLGDERLETPDIHAWPLHMCTIRHVYKYVHVLTYHTCMQTCTHANSLMRTKVEDVERLEFFHTTGERMKLRHHFKDGLNLSVRIKYTQIISPYGGSNYNCIKTHPAIILISFLIWYLTKLYYKGLHQLFLPKYMLKEYSE